jgi:hypothetical protein
MVTALEGGRSQALLMSRIRRAPAVPTQIGHVVSFGVEVFWN